MKNTLLNIALLAAVFIAGAFVNGRRTDAKWRDRVGNSPAVVEHYERTVNVPVPSDPVYVQGKPVKDTTGLAAGIAAGIAAYGDTAAFIRNVSTPFTGTLNDTNIRVRVTANAITRSFIFDSVWVRPVRCDSTVVTRIVVDTVKETASIRTGAAVAIGAAAGAKIGGPVGAAAGGLVGLAFDWIF